MLNDGNKDLIQTGVQYPAGGPVTTPASFVNSIAGGKTADVISATLRPGSVGLYQVLLHLNPDLPTDPYSQLTIAQDIYVSNIVTLPIAADGGSLAPVSNAAGSGARSLRRDLVQHRAAARYRFQRVCQRRQSVGRQRGRAGQYRLALRSQPRAEGRDTGRCVPRCPSRSAA